MDGTFVPWPLLIPAAAIAWLFICVFRMERKRVKETVEKVEMAQSISKWSFQEEDMIRAQLEAQIDVRTQRQRIFTGEIAPVPIPLSRGYVSHYGFWHILSRKVDDQNRSHCADGPALEQVYANGFEINALGEHKALFNDASLREKLYFWHGNQVPEYVIMEPDTITVWSIEHELNAELRRVMIERYIGANPNDGLDGYGRYIRDCKAEEIHRDKCGILWRKDLPGDEPLVMVEVLNSTVEKDGSRHRFFLRVDPQTRTARQACAWTFGLKAAEYEPAFET